VTYIEQKKTVAELKDYQNKMTRDEQKQFEMFAKRDKDDEDLDDISKSKLLQLYEKYITNKPKKVVKSPFGDIIER
jgi:hypothetical protein